MNNAASDELAALFLRARWCASERWIVQRRVEVRPGEVGVLEVCEVTTDLVAVARLDEQEQVLDEQVDLGGGFVAEPRKWHARGLL